MLEEHLSLQDMLGWVGLGQVIWAGCVGLGGWLQVLDSSGFG
jgi:hypothetical protein